MCVWPKQESFKCEVNLCRIYVNGAYFSNVIHVYSIAQCLVTELNREARLVHTCVWRALCNFILSDDRVYYVLTVVKVE
jgi:hypothetical protein